MTAAGHVELGAGCVGRQITVGPEGLAISDGEHLLARWRACEIGGVIRDGYTITLRHAWEPDTIALRRFARRTDELELALRRCRADALAELMAPPGERAVAITEAVGDPPGYLYRYADGLRWVPDTGDCFTRLYGELDGAVFDDEQRALVLSGPFGEQRIGGLRRPGRELAAESERIIGAARAEFAECLDSFGLSWSNDISSGKIRPHVPFAATEQHLRDIELPAGLIAEERREYWELLREHGDSVRLVVSPGADGLRIAAICRVDSGELYELLSESDHASFVFARADDAVRAWTEVGFRREPVFADEEVDEYRALAALLPSLRAARDGLRGRVIHGEPRAWIKRHFR